MGGFLGSLFGSPTDVVVKAMVSATVSVFVLALGDRLHDMLVDLYTGSTRPPVTAASFLSGDGPYHTVALFSTVLLVGTLILGVIEGLLSGQPGQAFARLGRQVPVAVLAIGGFPWLVDQMLTVADVLSTAVLPAAKGKELADAMAVPPSSDIPGLLLTLVAFAAGLLVTMELIVRDGLVLVVVALAPLSFAASVVPAARTAAGEVVKLALAVVLTKPAVFVALRIGIDQIHDQQAGDSHTTAWGRYLLGVTVLVLAGFMPYLVWRLMPLAAAYALAQGASRAPFRAAQQTAQQVFYARFLFGRGGGLPGGTARRDQAPDTDPPPNLEPRKLPTPTAPPTRKPSR